MDKQNENKNESKEEDLNEEEVEIEEDEEFEEEEKEEKEGQKSPRNKESEITTEITQSKEEQPSKQEEKKEEENIKEEIKEQNNIEENINDEKEDTEKKEIQEKIEENNTEIKEKPENVENSNEIQITTDQKIDEEEKNQEADINEKEKEINEFEEKKTNYNEKDIDREKNSEEKNVNENIKEKEEEEKVNEEKKEINEEIQNIEEQNNNIENDMEINNNNIEKEQKEINEINETDIIDTSKKNNEKNAKKDINIIDAKNVNQIEENEFVEQNDNEPLSFSINENLIGIINDELLNEEELFSKITSEIKIHYKNNDDIGVYIYIHFLFRNSFSLFFEHNKKDEENTGNLSDYLDNKITSFNFDKFMLYLKEEKILLNNIPKIKGNQNNNKEGALFEFINKTIEDNDINPDLCYETINDNSYKLLINYDLIKDSMYSKGQHDLFTKFYILYLLTKNKCLLPIVQKFLKLITNKKFPIFNEEKYLSYVDKILTKDNNEEINNIIDKDLIEQIKYFIDSNEKTSLFYLEKFLIQLLGHPEKQIRSKATKLLNIFYDGHILQLDEPFIPVIKYLNEDFEIEINLEENENLDNYFLFVSTPSRIFYVKNESGVGFGEENSLIFNLGKFKFCGYYDYVLINKENFKQELETKGRFIVQNNDIKYLNCHTLFVDVHNNSLDNSGKIKKQSTYKDVLNSINYFSKIGINGLNLIGVLERDVYLSKSESIISPMAVINRSKICSLLGTEKDFKKIIEEGNKNNIKIFIDMLSSISSSHFHRKYNNLNLDFVDKFGKLQCLFGTEGDTVKYEDNMILNYRDINSWNLLISDISELCEKYNISGVHLNNAQTWPQIYQVDQKEMLREHMEDEELVRHYSNYEIINGKVVIPNQECGYWNSFNFEANKNEKNEGEKIDDENSSIISNIYPNPLFIKMTKKIWEKYPEFIFIGEFINNSLKYNNREFILGKSGLVPKLNILPEIFTHLYAINTGINNIVPSFNKISINDIIKNYYNLLLDNLPLNSYFISASGGTIWPYPTLLYGPGCIPYITALFTLNNIPMTYMNEIYGKSKRYQLCSYYDSIKNEYFKENKNKKKTHNSNNYYLNKYKVADIEKQLTKTKGIKSNSIKEYYEKMRILRQSHKSLLNGKLFFIKNDNNKLLSFCREDLENNEIAFIGINFGETESKLELDFSYLLKKSIFKNLDINTIIKIENWDDSEINYYFIDDIFSRKHLINIMPYDSFMIGFSIVKPFEPDLYHKIFSDSLIDLCKKINDNLRGENKNNKPINKKFVSSLGNYSYDSYIISSQLKYLLENNLSLCEFAKWLNTIETILSEYNIKYSDYFNNLSFIQKIPQLSTQYYKYIHLLNSLPSYSFDKYPKINLYSDIIQDSNKFGSLCFITPEIGKWTSIGGLGVMIDELTQCLAKLGQNIIVIAPYYHFDKSGKSGYLENDENSFVYINDLEIKIDKNYIFKIFFGKKNNIKYYFIYNKGIFPEAYNQGPAYENVLRLALFGQASLELLCSIQNIPSIIITNDWFTGFIPAYGKSEKYSGIFKYCSFLHIVHNLEEGYQGVIYLPNNSKENYPEIIKLGPELIFEKNNNKAINPSQTAFMCCDQWGTVSKTYRDDLLNKSNLKDFMKEFPNPFACSNGIFRENRINEIKYFLKNLLKNKENNLNLDINEINLLNEDFKNICKAKLQQTYFNEEYNPKKILFSYLGRITEQKGIKIIVDNAEELIKKYNAQILIAGKANLSEKYALKCIEQMEILQKKYPQNFWSNPKEFFNDPILLRYGSDFGLMPSIFEPGGIVQHEYFISCTPVIAFKTGGLKDTIIEYNITKKIGNGFLFEKFENKDFLNACNRAVKIFGNKNEYNKLCNNAFDSAIDVENVAQRWGEEFYRLKNKIFFDRKIVENEIFGFRKNINNETKKFDDEMELYNDKKYIFGIKEPIEFEKTDDDDNEEGYLDVSFILVVEKGKKYKSVQITGSWDKWNQKFDLSYDPLNNSWKTYIILPKGITYLYKYIVDGEFVINKNEKVESKDNDIFNIIET